jgi:uncharacterized protein YceK
MKMGKKFAACLLAVFIMAALSGCASYYKVTDPASGKVYYTEDIDKKSSGAIEFKDEVTKTQVTLPTTEVMEITEDQFEANLTPR